MILEAPDLGRNVGPFTRYTSGAVYLGHRVVGHLVTTIAGMDRPGAGCGRLWRIERDPDACRVFERRLVELPPGVVP